MKKIRKISLSGSLNAKELKQLKGGSTNKNSVSSCICTYYDGQSLTNKNSVGGCSCECVGY